MKITVAIYVTTEKQHGATVYLCRPLIGNGPVTRDLLLRVALQRLANKARTAINRWAERGRAERLQSWLYDPDAVSEVVKLNLVLRDRTVQWKLLLQTRIAMGGFVTFSPAIPGVWFDVPNPSQIAERAVEVYSKWCRDQLADQPDLDLTLIGLQSDAWIEPVDIELSSLVKRRNKSRNLMAALMGKESMRGSDELRKVGRCLDDLAPEYTPALGRERIVSQVIRLLERLDRQPVMLVGPSGSGKTAIIEDCVQQRAMNHRGQESAREQIWWLSPQRLISGMSYLGQWEQRWLAILREATRCDHVLYFDELLGLLTAGITRDSQMCAADVLRSYLAQNQVRLLSEITPEALGVLRRRDRALAEEFHLVRVDALDRDATLSVLQRVCTDLETRTKTFFHPLVLPRVIEYQESLVPHRALPGKAIEVVKMLARSESGYVDEDSLAAYLERTTGVHRRMLDAQYRLHDENPESMEARLVGQPQAIASLRRVVTRAANRMAPEDRPLGVMLFLGPTGVGKTECAKALTEMIFKDESHLLRFDMNEIASSLAAEQLIGTFDQPDGRLTSAVRRKPHSVILLDEIEKAHPDVFDYLLQVLGEGRLTDAHGRTVDFRNTMIVLTSNLGASEMLSSLGFDATGLNRDGIYRRAAERFFRPEFYNRLDDVIVFRSLDRKDVRQIAELQLQLLLTRDGLTRRDVYLRVEDAILDWVVQRGFDARLGARAIKRALEMHLVQPLGDQLAATDENDSVWVRMTLAGNAKEQLAEEMRQIESGRKLGLPPSQSQRTQAATECEVHRLTIVSKPSTQPFVLNAENLATIGEGMIAHFFDELKRLEPDALNSSLSREAARVRYYALHEQVHACRDWLKIHQENVRNRASTSLLPTQGIPKAAKRPNSQRGVSQRRYMLDYQAESEIHEAILDSQSRGASQRVSPNQAAALFRQSLLLTNVMIEAADTGSRWLIEMCFLTNRPRYYNLFRLPGLANGTYPNAAVSDAYIARHEPASSYLVMLCRVLQSQLQYEVHFDTATDYRVIVDGTSLFGLLQPLLGTYRFENRYGERGLCCLLAHPVEAGVSFSSIPLDSFSASELARIMALPQWTEVRGTVGKSIVDYRSGQEIDFKSGPTQWMQWWTAVLPLPKALQQTNPRAEKDH